MAWIAAAVMAWATALTAQQQFDELQKRGLPDPPGDSTYAAALGDIDGDGDLDLILGNLPNQNRVFLNDGTGIYTDATAVLLPIANDQTQDVALGDVDGDGDLDLITANLVQNTLYLNDGTGTFTDATAARMPVVGDYTLAVALGDVDRDGDLDLVFANGYHSGSWQNRLCLNDGTGRFTDAPLPADNDQDADVALGDVDGDGDLDLVFANSGGQNRLYLNDGRGTFSPASLPVDSDVTRAVALGDVDGDGDLDIAFTAPTRLYLNSGSGTFTDVTAARLPVTAGYPLSVSLVDVDGDRDLDMVVGRNADRNELYLNDGTGTFADATAAWLPTDFDITYSLVPGDVDGDGDPDLLAANGGNLGGRCRLYLNDGGIRFRDATAVRMPADDDSAYAVAAGDVDGDGDADLVFGVDGQDRLYVNDGTGSYTDDTATRMPADSADDEAVALGDVDGDGDLDIVLATIGQNRLYLNDGAGTYTSSGAGQIPILNDSTLDVALGDVDGDGDPDLVFANGGTARQNRVCLNDGNGRFSEATTTLMPTDSDTTSAVALGDIDGDGDLDMVLGNIQLPTRLYLNDGSGTYTDGTARLPSDTEYTTDVALGDVDGDGEVDIVCANDGPILLYLNDGTGTFADVTAARMPPTIRLTQALALADVDGDGDLDMVLARASWANSSPNLLYVNLLLQLDAPYLLRVGHGYTIEFYARYGVPAPLTVAAPFLAPRTATIPLPPLGTLRLDPSTMFALPGVVIPQPAGMGAVSVAVPAVPSLAGGVVYVQAVVWPYPRQLKLTNFVSGVISR